MTHKRTKTVIASAVSLALASMMLAGGAYGGVVDNSNKTPGAPLGSCGPTQAATQACVGAMDLTNIDTTIYKADGTVLGTMNKTTGDYPVMGLADYFVSLVKSAAGDIVAKLSGKVWPVGEPMAVKAVVGDMQTKEGKPNNCIINTAFLSADKNPTGVSGYLDTADPVPVICSSDFQSHKRFKIPMQPASLDPATARDIRSLIRGFAADRTGGVLWTSHNMYEVEEVCHRVLFLSHGKILLEGDPKTLPREHGKTTLEELFITVAREPLALELS